MEYRLLVATRLRLTVNITDFGMLILHSLLSPSLPSCSLWHHYPSSPRLCVLQTPSPTLPLIEYALNHLCSPVQIVDPVAILNPIVFRRSPNLTCFSQTCTTTMPWQDCWQATTLSLIVQLRLNRIDIPRDQRPCRFCRNQELVNVEDETHILLDFSAFERSCYADCSL